MERISAKRLRTALTYARAIFDAKEFTGDVRRTGFARAIGALASDKVYGSSRFIAFVSFVKADRCVIAARDGRRHCCACDKPD